MRLKPFLAHVLLVVLSSGNALAQQTQQHSNETGWLVEVTFLQGAPPAYEKVRSPQSQSPGDWFGRFGQVSGWQVPEGAEPVRAVRITPRLNEEKVRIIVSVLSGKKFMDMEETVASYDLMEDEKVTVEPLKDFGVVPFEIKVVRAAPLMANLPTPINMTKSVEVVSLNSVASTVPECQLTLHNLSMKPIDAVRVDVVDGSRVLSSGMPQGIEGKPLMLAGEIIQVRVPITLRAVARAGNYTPAVPVQQQIVIKSIIFADGTVDGPTERDIDSGPGFQAFKFGRRIGLQRALPLIGAALESTISSDGGVKKFRAKLERLSAEIADAELGDLQQRFPTVETKSLRPSVELGIHIMRKEIIDNLIRFQNGTEGKDFRAWLGIARERYSVWLTRLLEADTPTP